MKQNQKGNSEDHAVDIYERIEDRIDNRDGIHAVLDIEAEIEYAEKYERAGRSEGECPSQSSAPDEGACRNQECRGKEDIGERECMFKDKVTGRGRLRCETDGEKTDPEQDESQRRHYLEHGDRLCFFF